MSQPQPVRTATAPKLRQAVKHSGRDPDSHRSLNVTGTGTKIDVSSNLDLDCGSYSGFVTTRRQPHESLDARLQQKKLNDELISDSEIEYLIKEKLRKEQYAVECLFKNADPTRCGRVNRNALLRILYSICGHIRFEQFHRLLDSLGLEDKQSVSFADFKASFAAPASQQQLQQLTVTLDADPPSVAQAGPQIGRYSTKPVSVAHAFTMLRQRASQVGFDPREVLPPACFEPGGVVLKPQLRQALALLRIPLAACDVDKFWDRFDLQGTGAVSTGALLTLMGIGTAGARGVKPVRSKTAPARKLARTDAAVPAPPPATAAVAATAAAAAVAVEGAAPTEKTVEESAAQKCQSAEPAASVGDLKYLKGYELLRKNRPKFDHFLDDLHYRFDEPYNALLVTFRHFDSAQAGCVGPGQLRQVLHGFGFPTAGDAEFDQFLMRFGLRSGGGSQGFVSYADLLTRMQARGSNSLLARYLMSDKSPLTSEDSQTALSPGSESLSPYQMELQLLRFLHRDYLQLHCGLNREDPQKTGSVSEEAFRSVLGRVCKAEVPSEQVSEALARLPGGNRTRGVPYRSFLERFHIPPNAWSKQPVKCRDQVADSEKPLSQPQLATVSEHEVAKPGAAAAATAPAKPARDSGGGGSGGSRSVLEVSQLAQTALSDHFHQVDKLYKQMDRRNTGRMSRAQFWTMLNSLGLRLTESEVGELWATLDTSADGQWSYRQMLRHFMSNLHERALERLRANRNWQRCDTVDPNVLKLRQMRLAAAESGKQPQPQPQQPLELPPVVTQPEVTRRQLEDLLDRCRPRLVGNWDQVKMRLRRLDPEGTSCIQRLEFRDLAREFQLPLTGEEIDSLARGFEKNGSGRFNYMQFLKRFVCKSAKPVSRTQELARTVTDKKQGSRVRIDQIMDKIREKLLFEWQSLLLAFRKFDTEKCGHLSLFELRKIVSQCGYHLSEDDLFLLLTEFDLDFDGKINYQEFVMQLLDVAETA